MYEYRPCSVVYSRMHRSMMKNIALKIKGQMRKGYTIREQLLKLYAMVWLALLGTLQILHAQTGGTTIEVELDPDSILAGNVFYLTYTVKGEEGKFELPEIEGLEVLSQSMRSSFVFSTGEGARRVQSFTYVLRAEQPGDYLIPPARFYLQDGSVLETNPVEICVLPNPDNKTIPPRRQDYGWQQNRFFWHFDASPPPANLTMPDKRPRKKRKRYKF